MRRRMATAFPATFVRATHVRQISGHVVCSLNQSSTFVSSTRGFYLRSFASAAVPTSNDDVPCGGVSLVQGASRGLGLEFVRQLLENRPEGHVVATCRNPNNASELAKLRERHGKRVSIVPLDVTEEETIAAAAGVVREEFGSLDLLVNTAGILHIPKKMQPETGLQRIDPEALMMCYRVNAMGPILVTKHMSSLLSEGGGRQSGRVASVIANISARVGSIGDNRLGGWYSYRASKSALNQLTRTASVELARKKSPVVSILLHPGTVDTDLSKPFQRNVAEGKLFTRQYSVECMMKIIDNVEVKDNGRFFAWDGQEIPW